MKKRHCQKEKASFSESTQLFMRHNIFTSCWLLHQIRKHPLRASQVYSGLSDTLSIYPIPLFPASRTAQFKTLHRTFYIKSIAVRLSTTDFDFLCSQAFSIASLE
ncbi:hypothetical protein TRVL_08315 [Trypanosoma vivax]|nr:hypothetical protein TRVL_08315 [Trypanosoma vivax]